MLDTSERKTGSSVTTLNSIWKESNTYQVNTSRLERQVSTLQGLAQAWTTGYTYDVQGHLETTAYPSGLTVKKVYTDFGQLRELSDANTGGVYWSAEDQDAWGNVSAETTLGSITGSHTSYDSTGQAKQKQWMQGPSLLNRLNYSYDSFGNLKNQSTAQTGIDASEGYTYDGLQRLTKATRSGVPGSPAPVTYDYHPNGNLKFKSDYSQATATAYSYNTGGCGPHGVSRVQKGAASFDYYYCDANGNVTGGALTASYDFNNQPWRVTRSAGTAEFSYSANGDVFRSTTPDSTWFGPAGYEETLYNGTRSQRHELGPVIVLRESGGERYKAVLRDRLGSQVMLVDGVPSQTSLLSLSPNPSTNGLYTANWSATPGATGYELWERINGAAATRVYSGPARTWSPASARPIGRYSYQLRSCTPICGAYSSPVVEEVVPAPPSTLTSSPNPSSNGNFTLSWPSVAQAERYQIEEKESGAADYHVVASEITGLTWNAIGKPAGDYQYRVRSCLTLCGNPGNPITQIVTGGGSSQAPGAPTLNPATVNGSQIALSWTPAPAPSPQPDYYVVLENGATNIHVPSGTSLSLTRGNGTFTYKVRGCRVNPLDPYRPFCGMYSNTVTVTVTGSGIPAVPTGVASSLTSCSSDRTDVSYSISWNASAGATRYELTETNDYDATISTDTNAVSPESRTHSVPQGLDSITYRYTVKACSASGCSQDSAAALACIGIPQVINGPDASPQTTAYDAFGKVRNGNYSDKPNGTLDLIPDTVRGFTGHQHADNVRLIHMNGRIYDYQLGRFLSVDPIIQFPANSQSLNPYSYILNNPLSGMDPSGYAVCSLDAEASCLLQDDGINTIVDAGGNEIATAIVADKGDNVTVTGNGGSISATFTGKTGDISRVLAGGPPSDIGAISQRTNGTLDGTAATYAQGPDKSPGSAFDFMVAEADAQRQAEQRAFNEWSMANQGLQPVAILPVEVIGQSIAEMANEAQQPGGMSLESAGGLAVTAMAGMLKVPGAGAGAAKTVGSKIDRVAFKKVREAYWKKEAATNPGNYSPADLAKMKAGRAPTGPDGKPIELHHRDGTSDGPLDPMSRTDHRGGENYKKNHPWLGD